MGGRERTMSKTMKVVYSVAAVAVLTLCGCAIGTETKGRFIDRDIEAGGGLYFDAARF